MRSIRKVTREFGKVYLKLYLPKRIKKDNIISTIIVEGSTITAPTEMAENVNNFFNGKFPKQDP